VDSDGEVIFMLKLINNRHNALSEALNIIDPEGAFVPGTKEYSWLEGLLITWMDEMEPAEVLRKSATAGHMLRLIAHTIP
jgi:hypothetical protein